MSDENRLDLRTETSPKQKKAVDNMASGEFRSKGAAMRGADYAPTTSQNPARLLRTEGVQAYLKTLSKAIKKKLGGVELERKVIDVYVEGLSATKLSGKDAVEHPDHLARKAFADTFAEFFGWKRGQAPSVGQINQFTFFSVSEEERENFNEKFVGFLDRYYRPHV